MHAEVLLIGRTRLLELIATDAPLDELLEALARMIEEQRPGLLCTVLLLVDGTLRHGAAPSLSAAYRAAIEGMAIGRDVGSCGHAAFTGEEAIAEDIATDPRWARFLDVARADGLASCWSTPIRKVSGEVLGTFAMYHRLPYTPTSADRELVVVATHLAEVAIERARSHLALRNQAEALRAETQRKDEFLAMLAHELRGPLAPIVNAGEFLAQRLPDGTPEGRAASVVRRQTGHLIRLVDDLLDVARITRGKISLDKAPTTLEALLGHAVEMAQPLAESAGVTLVMHPARGAPLPVEADSVRMAQALFNVLGNAIKFTPRGGRVDARTDADGDGGRVSISDTGIGIAPDLLSTIFDLFRQGTQSLDRTRGGLGIGLTVAKRLVEMHGGHITAHSDGVGRGTKVVLWLPTATTIDEATSSSTTTPTAARPRRVLVVDDNADGADMIAMGLTTPKNEVKTACDGVAAMAIARAWKPDVVLLDIGLPGMDGFEVARRLRALPEGEQISIIATTGYGDERTRERSRLAGFDLHLVKPVSIEALARAVSAAR